MNDRLALRLSDGWALRYDAHQWIVCKGRKLRSERKWHAQTYIGSCKATLRRVLQEIGADITPAAQSIIDTWPERFVDWRKANHDSHSATVDRFAA